jgi:hypothetical protein
VSLIPALVNLFANKLMSINQMNYFFRTHGSKEHDVILVNNNWPLKQNSVAFFMTFVFALVQLGLLFRLKWLFISKLFL